MTRPSTDQRLRDALARLLAGTPTRTSGALNVRTLCAEAELSKHSYYRSSIRAELESAMANATSRGPEIERLKAEIKDLNAEINRLKVQHSSEVNELTTTVTDYANQIQALSLHAAQLTETNKQLRKQGSNVIALPSRS